MLASPRPVPLQGDERIPATNAAAIVWRASDEVRSLNPEVTRTQVSGLLSNLDNSISGYREPFF